MSVGRFAPSPTGPLHLGNLRTALAAWLFARSTSSDFLLRFEDLDQALVQERHYRSQEEDLASLGLHWDGLIVRQSDRTELYTDAINQLEAANLTYECFCSRKDIREASQAPNGPQTASHYPGTCLTLSKRQRQERREAGRPPAIRIRADGHKMAFTDQLCGRQEGTVDDFVIKRNDGTPAYNLAVVVDDAAQEITQVVRGDDLLGSTVRQLFAARTLGLRAPSYAHVPLVLAPNGKRLAKRDGATTLADRLLLGETPATVLLSLAASLGLNTTKSSSDATVEQIVAELVSCFQPTMLGRTPHTLSERYLAAAPPPGARCP